MESAVNTYKYAKVGAADVQRLPTTLLAAAPLHSTFSGRERKRMGPDHVEGLRERLRELPAGAYSRSCQQSAGLELSLPSRPPTSEAHALPFPLCYLISLLGSSILLVSPHSVYLVCLSIV